MVPSSVYEEAGGMDTDWQEADWLWSQNQWGKPSSWLDFSMDMNPLGPPQAVVSALQRALETPSQLSHYSDPHMTPTKTSIAQFLGVDEPCILLTNGCSEALDLAMRLMLPRRVQLIEPCSSVYARVAQANGAAVIRHQAPVEHDFHWQARPILQTLSDGDVLLFSHPGNPTGYLGPRDDLWEIWHKRTRNRGAIVVDETYLDFVPDASHYSFRFLAGLHRDFIIVGSLSKLFALPGLRAGYMIANPEIIRDAAVLQPLHSVNLLAQAALEVAVRDVAYLHQTRSWLPKVREGFLKNLAALPGIRPIRGAANFILAEFSNAGLRGSTWQESLARHGLMLKTSNFEGLPSNYQRLAVRMPEENERLIECLQRLGRS